MPDAYRVPGVIDETEVATEKIRQAAETKRKQIEEREKTRRETIAARKVRWTDSGFQWLVGISLLIVFGTLAIVANVYFDSRKPAPRSCVAP